MATEKENYSKCWEKPLSPEEQKKLFARKIQGDAEARDILIASNFRLVIYIAKRYNVNHLIEEDLIDAGQIGLIKAVDAFDPSMGKEFATLATRCIDNEIRMELRRFSHDADYHAEFLSTPLLNNKNGDEYDLSNVLEDTTTSIDDIMNELSDKTRLYDALFCLGELDQKILKLRFGLVDGIYHKHHEIASIIGGCLKRATVCKRKMKALEKLRNVLNENYVYKKIKSRRFTRYTKNRLVSIIYEVYFNSPKEQTIEENFKEIKVDIEYFKQLLSQNQTISLKRFEKHDIIRYKEPINRDYMKMSYEELIKNTIPLVLYIISKCKKKGMRSYQLLNISCNALKMALKHLERMQTPYYCDFVEDLILNEIRKNLPNGQSLYIINDPLLKYKLVGRLKFTGRLKKSTVSRISRVSRVTTSDEFFNYFQGFDKNEVLKKLEKMPPKGRDIVKDFYGIDVEAKTKKEIREKHEIKRDELFQIVNFICDSILQKLTEEKKVREEQEAANKKFMGHMSLDEFLRKLNPIEKKLIELYKFYHNDTKRISQMIGLSEENVVMMLNALAEAADTITKGKIVDDKVFSRIKERAKCLRT